MSETPCKYCLHSKSSVNSLYTLNLLFLHIPECKLLITKFLNALFILDTASLEPSEVEVRSISLIISKTHFFHCFLFLPGILHLFHSFSKTFLQKLSLPFFNNLENQTTFLLFLLKFKGSIPKSPHTASLQVFEEQPKIFLHAANNTASNALDWDVVHLHTSLPYSNDGRRMDKITCLLTYKLKHGLFKIFNRLLTLRLPAITSSLICVSQCPLYVNFTPKYL